MQTVAVLMGAVLLSFPVAALSTQEVGEARESPGEPKVSVQVTAPSKVADDPMLARVTVHARRGTSLREFCRSISRDTGVRLQPARALAAEKLLLLAYDQPLERVLTRAASIMNASFVKVDSGAKTPLYQIEQLPAQARAEAEILDRPWADMVRRLEQLRAAASGAAVDLQADPDFGPLLKKYPNWAPTIGSLPQQDWDRLLAGQPVHLDPLRLSQQAVEDLRSELNTLAIRATAIGAARSTAPPKIDRIVLRPQKSSIETPRLKLEVTSLGYGRMRLALLPVRPLTHLGRTEPRVRELAGISPSPEPPPASPEVDLEDLKDDFTPYRVLEELAVRGKLNLAARYFRQPQPRAPMPRPAFVRRGSVLELVAALAYARQLLWGMDRDWLMVAPATWPFDRQAQIPDALLDRWLEAAEKKALSVEHVTEMALLSDAQLQRLVSFLWEPAHAANRYREPLRLWASLPPLHRQAALDLNKGLPAALVAGELADDIDALADPTPDVRLFAALDAEKLHIWVVRDGGTPRNLVQLRRPEPREYYGPRMYSTPPGGSPERRGRF